uniref:Uncharacterized protein n=1 Tax=Salix viminalis TaxID=40686 RepID=A0A6N2NG95_SALVM
MAAVKIPAVWRQNFLQEIFRLDAALFKFSLVSFDTEFPGFFRNTPMDATESTRKLEVDKSIARRGGEGRRADGGAAGWRGE